MIRSLIIRYLTKRNCHITQEYTKFEKFNHYRYMSSVKLKENEYGTGITSNIKSISRTSPGRSNQEEQEFLIRLKNDPDIFGDSAEKEIIDSKDLEEDKHFENQTLPSQKLRTKQYADIIKNLIRMRKIKEAIDVLEVRMLKEDQVKPENYIFNLLLGACGRVGYTKKAFSLYNQMKKRGLKVTGGTYTALFNACANSPWSEDGLTRAQHLREQMIEKMYEPNDTNYNAMIKAFGRCGDLPTAFSLVDEMSSKGFPLKEDTMNFLLQACIQDKDAGFRHALLVWRKMINKNIAPSLYTYNLMLRSIRDCGIGDIEVMTVTLNNIIGQETVKLSSNSIELSPKTSGGEEIPQQIESLETNIDNNSNVKQIQQMKSPETSVDNNIILHNNLRPDLMAKLPHLGNIVSLTEIKNPEDRLLLVGSMKGFLSNMVQNHCAPDIKTFTQLLDCLPGSLAAEKELLNMMKKFNVKPDVDFFNMLIKKRSMRFDYDAAKGTLMDMKKFGFRPNLVTYGVLSLGCKTKEEALELLAEMEEHSYRINTEILGAMLHQACYHKHFSYVLEIMEISLRENIKPNKKFMECLASFKKKCKDISNDKDHNLAHKLSFQKGFRVFQMRYKKWLEEVEVDDTDEVHPWAQFRQSTETDVKHYKEKSVRFKARHSSRFKVKTSLKQKKK